MDGMMRFPRRRRGSAGPRLGGAPDLSTTGYPWVDGDVLYAADLNAAFVPTTGGSMSGDLLVTGTVTTPGTVDANVIVANSETLTGGLTANGILTNTLSVTGAVTGTMDANVIVANTLTVSGVTDLATLQAVSLLVTSSAAFGSLPNNAANDAAAAAAGVPIGGVYRNGSVLMVRVT